MVTEKGLPHARASVLNLIVTVPDELSADRVVGTMLGLGFRHPSRAIVLVADPDAEGRALMPAVSAHCHAHQADEQVCYEEVVLTVRGEAAAHLDGIVAPLADPRPADAGVVARRPAVQRPGLRPAGRDGRSADHRQQRLQRPAGRPAPAWRPAAPQRHRRPRRGSGSAGGRSCTAQFFDAPRFRRYLPNLNRVIIKYALPPRRRCGAAYGSGRSRCPASPAPSPRRCCMPRGSRRGWTGSGTRR